LAPLGATGPFGHALALIDHDDVPVGVVKIAAVLAVVLECVDRDDRFVVVVKWVLIGRDLLADPLDADRIEPHQRDPEARPEFLLELHQHALGGHHQRPLAAPSADHLAAEDAAFQRFAQADRIGDQQPLAWHRQGLRSWQQLVWQRIHRGPVAHHQRGISGHATAQVGLKKQQAGAVLGRGVAHQGGVFRLQHLEAAGRLLHLHQEAGFLFAQERRHPHHIDHLLAIGAAAKVAHQPLGAAALDATPGGEDGFRYGSQSYSSRLHVREADADGKDPRDGDGDHGDSCLKQFAHPWW